MFKYLGQSNYEFLTKNNEVVRGTSLYVAKEKEGAKGLVSERFSVRENVQIPEFELLESMDLRFSQYGKIEKVLKVEK